MKRLAVAFSIMALVGLPAGPAVADEWPSRAVRIISPAAAGGTSDTLGRLLARYFGEMFNQKFFVENRTGAGGMIGAAAVASAPPDGYTLLISNVGYVVIAPLSAENPSFDTMRDLTHIAYLGGPPNVFVVNSSLGIKTLDEFIAYARKTGLVDYVSPGLGTSGNLTAERFASKVGIKLQHIPTRGGGSAIGDIVAGTVPAGSMAWTSALGQIRAGTVTALAVSSNERMPGFPDLPTLKELGYPEFVDSIWFGLGAPAGTPPDVIAKLSKATRAVIEMPEVKERLARDGVEQQWMTPEQFTTFVGAELTKWEPLARGLRKAK